MQAIHPKIYILLEIGFKNDFRKFFNQCNIVLDTSRYETVRTKKSNRIIKDK